MDKDFRVTAKLKYLPEDFIVEEIGEKWNTKVSEKFVGNLPPDLSALDLSSKKDFLWLEMEKKDIDHMSAIGSICKFLEVNKNDIGYAGMKDKVAWTSQRISIFNPDINKLKEFSHNNIILKNFKWNKRKIKIGYLKENHFKIILRDIDKKDAIKIVNKIKSLNFFPNYFGSQRFGSMRKNNVKIGKLILKKKFKDAVFAILGDVGEEKEEINNARLRFKKEKDIISAREYFPSYLKLENRILNYLSKNPKDYFGAIKNSDRKILLMIINSVQSAIFNDILRIALEEGLNFTKDGQKSCLLMGYKSKFFNGPLGDIEKSVLKNHGLELEDFNLKEIPFLKMKGSFRKAVTEIENLEVSLSDDELFVPSKKIELSFNLPSGVYATTFLENFFILN